MRSNGGIFVGLKRKGVMAHSNGGKGWSSILGINNLINKETVYGK